MKFIFRVFNIPGYIVLFFLRFLTTSRWSAVSTVLFIVVYLTITHIREDQLSIAGSSTGDEASSFDSLLVGHLGVHRVSLSLVHLFGSISDPFIQIPSRNPVRRRHPAAGTCSNAWTLLETVMARPGTSSAAGPVLASQPLRNRLPRDHNGKADDPCPGHIRLHWDRFSSPRPPRPDALDLASNGRNRAASRAGALYY